MVGAAVVVGTSGLVVTLTVVVVVAGGGVGGHVTLAVGTGRVVTTGVGARVTPTVVLRGRGVVFTILVVGGSVATVVGRGV